MKLDVISKNLGLTCLTPELKLDSDISCGYVSDMLSDIIVHSRYGGILVTIQTNVFALAAAIQAEFDGVIYSFGKKPQESVILKAVEENMPLFTSEDSAFDIVGRLYFLGIKGQSG